MRKGLKIQIASVLMSAVALGYAVALIHNVNNNKVAEAWSGDQTPNIGNYYASISDSLTGSALQSALKQKNDSLSISPSYNWDRYEAADEAEGDNNSIWCVYTRHAIGKSNHCGSYSWTTWNREHVWTQSAYPASDKDNHNIFACEGQINNYRGNLPYAEVDHTSSTRQTVFGHQTDCYIQNGKFEPCDEAKGEIARAVMYGVVMYDYTMTNMIPYETVLKWNLEHPVSNRDIYRNNKVQQLQGNRNPFVDHPEYACKIWGNTNATTKSICESTTPVTPKTLESIDVTLADGTSISSGVAVDVNSYQSLKVTAIYDDSSTTDVTASATFSTTANSQNYSSYISFTGNKLFGVAQTNYAAFSVSYGGKTTVRKVQVTPEGTGNGTPAGGGSGGDGNFTLYSGALTEGNYIITYDGNAMNTTVSSSRLMFDGITPTDNTISNPDASIVWHISQSGDYWTIYNEEEAKYAVSTGAKNQAGLSATLDNKAKWTVSGNSTYDFTNKNNSDSSINAILRKNGSYGFACYGNGTGGALTLYKESSSSSTKTLESIAVSNAKTEYTVGDTFVKPTVTATYDDDSTAVVTNSALFEGYDMSREDIYTVDVSYTEGEVTAYTEYDIIVMEAEISSITATVDKTFYVGETISKSDITVKDNLGNTITDFTFSSYQYTYNDAASGGALTNKNFTITYGELSTTLTTKVQRKARVTPESGTKSITYSDLPTAYDTSESERTSSSGLKFIAYNCANYSSKMQFKAKGGYLELRDALPLQTVTINNRETNALTVYGSNTKGSFSTTITGTNDVYNLSGYTYFKIMKSGDGAAYCSSITIAYSGSDSAVNLANYIMFEDENNQCETKFGVAKGYFEGLTKAERSAFMTGTSYVVSTARERLIAWAKHLGKVITQSGDDYVINNARSNFLAFNNQTDSTIIIVVALSISMLSFAGFMLLRRKKHE